MEISIKNWTFNKIYFQSNNINWQKAEKFNSNTSLLGFNCIEIIIIIYEKFILLFYDNGISQCQWYAAQKKWKFSNKNHFKGIKPEAK